MKISPIFAWYDCWIGVFISTDKRRIYVFPLPCIGFIVEWTARRSRSEKIMCDMIEKASVLSPKEVREMR